MKFLHSLAALATAALVAQTAWGQPGAVPPRQPARPAPTQSPGSLSPSSVAVIDMASIFEKYSGFQSRKGVLLRDMETAEAKLKSMQDTMKNLAEQLKELRPGGPEYKQLEADLATRNGQFQVQAQLQKNELLDREAKLFYTTYLEVVDEVKVFCESNAINLVLLVTGGPVDVNDLRQVAKEVNKGVVYYNQSIDISQPILSQLERRQPRQQARVQGPGPARPAPR